MHISLVLGMGMPKTRGCPYHHITAILEDDWGRRCCTCEQDTEKQYRGQQFCQNEKGHFVPTTQRWSQIFRLDGTLMESAPFLWAQNFSKRHGWLVKKAPVQLGIH